MSSDSGPSRGHPFRRRPLLRPGLREGVDLELRHHVEERIDRLIEEGWSPDEARREAERRFGRMERYRAEVVAEAGHDMGRRWMMGGWDTLIQDVRFALRGIRRNPGFASTLVATLALGIGATGGVFSVLDAVMLRPLPYAEPERLVQAQPHLVGADVYLSEFQTAQVASWRERADFLMASALHDRVGVVRTDLEQAEELAAIAASHDLDDVLGIEAAMGRLFVPEDATEDRKVVVLSWAYWTRTGADPDIVGSTLRLDDETWMVVGVLGRSVKFPVSGTSDLWIPMGPDGSVLGRTQSQTGIVGRLLDGVELPAAQERADALAAQLSEAEPTDLGWNVRLTPVGAWRANGDTARGLWMVAGAALAMLLIALVNGTNLLLVRGQARIAEVGVRKALGASRTRIVRQVLLESVVLALAAGVAATGVAWLGVEAIGAIAPQEVTFGMVHDFGLEPRALTVVFLVAMTSGFLVGMLPGAQLARTGVSGSGSADARARDRTGTRLRSGLVVVEVALSVVLLVGAGLFLRSFSEMVRVDLGIATGELAFLTVDLPRSRYPDGPDRADFVDRLTRRLEALPGARSVAVGMGAPPEGGGISFGSAIQAEGRDPLEGDNLIPFVTAGPGYLETLGAELHVGRDLQEGDLDSDGVVIDRDLAELLFGVEAPVGRRFTMDADDDEIEWLTVVGVVDELALGGPDDRIGAGALIYPLDLASPSSYLVFSVRTDGKPGALLGEVRQALRSIDPRLPVVRLQTGTEAVGEALSRPRFVVLLMAIMATLALVLAAVGIYGVVSYSVRQRRREMGIRIALGAPIARVRGLVVRWGLAMAVLGTALGLLAASLLDDLAGALLFGVRPGDLGTRVVVALLMILVTALSCVVPARRATAVDPVEVLKSE